MHYITWKLQLVSNAFANDCRLWEAGLDTIEIEISSVTKKQEKYIKYTPQNCYNIGKNASKNGPVASVQMFQIKSPKSNESTARTSRQKYEFKLSEAKRIRTVESTSICRIQVQWPLLFGEIDDMVQCYLVAANNRGAVISAPLKF